MNYVVVLSLVLPPPHIIQWDIFIMIFGPWHLIGLYRTETFKLWGKEYKYIRWIQNWENSSLINIIPSRYYYPGWYNSLISLIWHHYNKLSLPEKITTVPFTPSPVSINRYELHEDPRAISKTPHSSDSSRLMHCLAWLRDRGCWHCSATTTDNEWLVIILLFTRTVVERNPVAASPPVVRSSNRGGPTPHTSHLLTGAWVSSCEGQYSLPAPINRKHK